MLVAVVRRCRWRRLRNVNLSRLIICQLLNARESIVWFLQTVELVSSMHVYYCEQHCGTHFPVGIISFQLILHKAEMLNLNELNAVKGFVLLLLWDLRFCCHKPTQ